MTDRTSCLTIICNLNSSYNEFESYYKSDFINRFSLCDESRTMIVKLNDTQALILHFDIDLIAYNKYYKSNDRINQLTYNPQYFAGAQITLPHA